MSPQSQHVIGLYRDVDATKNRCCHNIRCPLGLQKFGFLNCNAICFEQFMTQQKSLSVKIDQLRDVNIAFVQHP